MCFTEEENRNYGTFVKDVRKIELVATKDEAILVRICRAYQDLLNACIRYLVLRSFESQVRRGGAFFKGVQALRISLATNIPTARCLSTLRKDSEKRDAQLTTLKTSKRVALAWAPSSRKKSK